MKLNPKEQTMSLKLNRFSLIATLSILAATAGAHAAPGKESKLDALESGNPHSVSYGSRDVGSRKLTQEDLDSLESGNPNSVNYANRPVPGRGPTNEELQALESGNPDAIK
jgi:hypothetical protein